MQADEVAELERLVAAASRSAGPCGQAKVAEIMCVCVYIYIYTYMHICIYIYIYM